MAFVVKFKSKGEYTFYVNGISSKPDRNTDVVEFLQASGHELELIKTRFANIPYKHDITLWNGEMAQFIYDNLYP